MKKVGVVIPIYNVEKYLRECLESVVNQTYTNLEVVLVNDGSTDENSLKIAKEYVLKDTRFVLIDKENGGQSSARNVGIEYFAAGFELKKADNNYFENDKINDLVCFEISEKAKLYKSKKFFPDEKLIDDFVPSQIDFIVFLDPDDFWSLNCIEECIKRADGVDIVWFDYKMFYDNLDKKYYENNHNLTLSQMQLYEYYKPEKISSQSWLKRCLKIQSQLPFWCVWGGIYSFRYLLQIRLKFLEGLIHEDVHFGILLFVQAREIFVLPKVLYYYRIRSSSTAAYDKQSIVYPYMQDLLEIFEGNFQIAKQYHAKSSIFLNAWYIREFIQNELDKEKGILLEKAFFMFLYFWHFDIMGFEKDPRRVKELFFQKHRPVFEENYALYPQLDFMFKYGLAESRVKNHLSFLLGKAMVENANCNSFYKLPFELFKAILKFKRFRKEHQKLPSLRDYPDNRQADVVKGYLSYRIGNATLRAFKEWYILKPLFLPFTWYRIYKKFKRNSRISGENIQKPYFVLPDNAFTDVARDKQAFQSLSVFSKNNDACRAVDSNLRDLAYAFCTCKEQEAWWILDLGESICIEMIRLTNVYNHYDRAKMLNLHVYISLDGNYWTLIGRDFYVWKHSDLHCDIIVSQKISARWIKIISREGEALSLAKVEVFKRNKRAYIISAKPDGLGMRLASMLIGIYLARKLDFEFGFLWDNSIDLAWMGVTESKNDGEINYLGNCMDEVDAVFSQEFIDKYFLSQQQGVEYNHGDKIRKQKRTFQTLKDVNAFEKEWGWYSTDILPSLWIEDCQEDECLGEFRKIYQDIDFSREYKEILALVDHEYTKLNGDFVALHIRGGDLIFSNMRKAPNFAPAAERLFPYEIALQIALDSLRDNKTIVVFGQDLNANEKLVNYLKTFSEFNHLDIINIDALVNKEYNQMQRTFFEINFMSKAQRIYSARESVFSKCAMMISGKNNLVSFHSIFSPQIQLKLIEQNFNKLDLHPLQSAMSCFRLFQLSKELKQPVQYQINFLEKALRFDDENDAYRIHILQCLFLQEQYELINKNLKDILHTRFESFFQTLLPYSLGAFGDCYTDYTTFKDEKYPYIAFVGYKICDFLGDLKQAKELKTYALKNNQTKDELLVLDEIDFTHKSGGVRYIKSSVYYALGRTFVQGKFIKTFQMLNEKEYLREKVLKEEEILTTGLKDFDDYDKALKIQKHLSYRLGKLLFHTHQNRYRGAYLVFPYKFYKIYRSYKKEGR